MNYLLDSNILIYAKMDSMPEHSMAKKWLELTVADQNNTVSLCETSVLSFLRITTKQKVFNPVLTNEEAQEFVDSLLNYPNVHLLYPSPVHFVEVIKLMDKHALTGDLVMDAHLAVFALTIGATLVTRDKDFAKIPYLKTFNPLTN